MRRTLATAVAGTLLLLAAAAPALASPADGVRTAIPVGGPSMATHGTVVTAGGTPLPTVHAAAFVVADATTGTVLAARDPHATHYPASTLKTLTALTLLPMLDPKAVYVARPQDSNAEGSRVGMVAGAPYTVDDLWHGLFLPSGNDAASGLANAAGGWVSTVAAMNGTAGRIQAFDTHAVNPSGLDAPGQTSSAYDLALIARAGLAMPAFKALTTTKRYAFPGKAAKPGAKRSTFQIQNQNKLLMHGYPGAVGVKTGYTTLAGRTFVGAAERNGHLIVVSLMHIGDASEVAAERLLDWGFRNVGKPGVGTLVDPVPDATPSPTSTSTAGSSPAGSSTPGSSTAGSSPPGSSTAGSTAQAGSGPSGPVAAAGQANAVAPLAGGSSGLPVGWLLVGGALLLVLLGFAAVALFPMFRRPGSRRHG